MDARLVEVTDPPARTTLLFAYGSLLFGERDHDLLTRMQLVGPALTAPTYYLVDLGVYGALVSGGRTAVTGELYRIDIETRSRIDVRKEHPVLFERSSIVLSDATRAEAYLMSLDKVRGRRRLKGGSWRDRFAPPPRIDSPYARWARNRRF